MLRIPQSSIITITTPSDYLVSYTGHSLLLLFLPLFRSAVGVFWCPNRQAIENRVELSCSYTICYIFPIFFYKFFFCWQQYWMIDMLLNNEKLNNRKFQPFQPEDTKFFGRMSSWCNGVSEFVLQSRYYVHFQANALGKGMNTLFLPAMG